MDRVMFAVVVGGALWAFLCWQLVGVRRTRSWPSTTAEAVAIRRMTSRKSGAEPDRILYAPLLRFWVPERGQVEAVPDYWTTRSVAQVGEKLAVRYDPADPEKVVVVGARKSGAVFLVLALIAIPAFVAVFALM